MDAVTIETQIGTKMPSNHSGLRYAGGKTSGTAPWLLATAVGFGVWLGAMPSAHAQSRQVGSDYISRPLVLPKGEVPGLAMGLGGARTRTGS